jgi:hypothetical protein
VTHATGRGRRCSRPAGFAALAVLVATTSAVASSGVPVGFGDARFGMPPDAVKRIFPALTQIPGIPSAGIASARLDGQTFAGLSPCELTFNFLDDKLYEIQFDCGRDPKVTAVLEHEFGRPTLRESYGVFWYGEKVVLSLSPGSQAFGLSDPLLIRKAEQAALRAATAEKAANASAPPAGHEPAATKP